MSPSLNRREFLKIAAGLLASTSVPAMGFSQSAKTGNIQDPTQQPNIIILVLDALSARHMSLYGYPRQTTPNIEQFAKRATVFHHNYSGSNFTTPGTASLLTGVYPWSHCGLHVLGTVDTAFIDKNLFAMTPPGFHKLAYTQNHLALMLLSQFRDYTDDLPKLEVTGLTTDMISSKFFWHDYNIALQEEEILLGYDGRMPSLLPLAVLNRLKNFRITNSVEHDLKTLFPRGVPQVHHGMHFLLEQSIDWIQDQLEKKPQPLLAYIHLWPPHDPYTTRREFVGLFTDGWKPPTKDASVFELGYSEGELIELRRFYDEYIAYVDSEFGRLYHSLEQSGILEHSYLILTTDHGEMFERGIWGHVTPTLFEPVIHVPLIISAPNQQKRQDVFEVTSGVDLLPTILHLTGQPVPDWIEGEKLPLNHSKLSDRAVFSMVSRRNSKFGSWTKGTVVLLYGQYKLIHYSGYDECPDHYELYQLENDPEEMENIYSTKLNLAKDLAEMMSEKIKHINTIVP